MEMDVNLVRCLRSTVGMSDIDRCYNDFILNGVGNLQPQHQQSSSTSNNTTHNHYHYQQQQHHYHHNINNQNLYQNVSCAIRPPPPVSSISGNLVRMNNESANRIDQSASNCYANRADDCNDGDDDARNIIVRNASAIFNNGQSSTTAASLPKNASILNALGTTTPGTPVSKGCCIAIGNRNKLNKTPQEIYFESRGKSCKKLLKFNGYSNKILLYPEESWARSAASSYWTIKPSWWQPNRCKVTEITGSQRYSTKAKMICIEKGSLLVMGSFKKKLGDADFKLYLSSNITMEDYNMGYCLTGWVERRCSQTNAFQMTHFAVIKRQWPPSITNANNATNDSKSN